MVEEALGRVGPERLYRDTGTQLMEISTVFQLMAEHRAGTLERARRLLLMPDLFHHLLSGSTVAEYTVVSTTGAYDMAARRWATDLLAELGIPTHMLPEVVDAGTDLGPVRLEEDAFRSARVIAPAAHDTASAVVSVPFGDPGAAYVSSGTWSLVGVETAEPVLTEAARLANLTNEGGAFGTIRLRRTLDDLAAVTDRPVTAVHIVGGGSRNRLLNQSVADVTGLPVVAGPVEATALGNLLVQLIALGELKDLAQARELVRAGTGPEIRSFAPSADDRLTERYDRYRELVAVDREEVGV
jgi:sugar (pentulose or hexulose) kinase